MGTAELRNESSWLEMIDDDSICISVALRREPRQQITTSKKDSICSLFFLKHGGVPVSLAETQMVK